MILPYKEQFTINGIVIAENIKYATVGDERDIAVVDPVEFTSVNIKLQFNEDGKWVRKGK